MVVFVVGLNAFSPPEKKSKVARSHSPKSSKSNEQQQNWSHIMFRISILFITAVLACSQAMALSSGRYTLINRHSGLAMDVDNTVAAAGANVIQWSPTGATNQQFDVTELSNGNYTIRPAHTGMSLDVWEWSEEPGGEIRQWDYSGAINQQWEIVDLGNGYSTIISAFNGLALDGWEWSTSPGADVRQWTATGGNNQQWAFQAVGGTTPPPTGNDNCVNGSFVTSANLAKTGASGPFTVKTKNVSSAVSGFGGGTIHYPSNAGACGRMPGIAVVPGYMSYESSIKWWGPRLASWGFVVITIDTNSIYDQPNSRATQLSKALDYIIADSTVKNMVDSNNLGAIGWSMGGGGSLKLSTSRSQVKAIIPQAPWYSGSYGTASKPAFFIACENDAIAPVSSHVNKFYSNHVGPKMKIEVNNGDHFCANSGKNESLLGKPGIAWMKRYLSGDTRFNQFLCGQTNYGSSSSVSKYNYSSCP